MGRALRAAADARVRARCGCCSRSSACCTATRARKRRATTSARSASRRRSASSATALARGPGAARARCGRANATTGGASTTGWKRFKRLRGADGRRAFAIPMALSSRDPRAPRARPGLDARLARRRGLHSAARSTGSSNYACRDDYGAGYRDVSAWAGIHYFASRDAARRAADPRRCSPGPKATAGSCGGCSSATRRR